MISWIQRTFQQHFRLVFSVILGITVLSFVFTIGSTPGVGRAERRAVTEDFFGYNLGSQEVKARVFEDARVSALLRFGPNVNPDQIEVYAFERLATLHLADEVHIPATSPAELQEFIQSLRLFQGADGAFDRTRYDNFRMSLRGDGSYSQGAIARVLSEDVRINKVELYLGGPGYVLPAGVQEIITKGDTVWSLDTVTVPYASYDPGVKVTDAQIQKFFADNSFRYTIPPRVSADFVGFDARAYLGKVSATDAEVHDFYTANIARFPNSAAAPGAKHDAASDFAAVQGKVREALLLGKARKEAVKAASDFAYALYEGKVARANVGALLAQRGLKTQPLAPFTRDAGPAELGGPGAAAAAFELTADRYYSEGIETPFGAAVILWNQLIPSHDPVLAEVREKVASDAQEDEKRRRFLDFGQRLRTSLEAKLKAGIAFDKAASEAAGSIKIETKSYKNFSLRNPGQGLDSGIFNALEGLEKGAVSAMQAGQDKGVIVYAEDKKVPAADPSNPRFVQVWGQLAMAYAHTDSSEILREVVDREYKRMQAVAK